jgi:hypothetical protein
MFHKTVLSILLLAVTMTLNATDIKGKVKATNSLSKEPYSLKGVEVDLYTNRAKKWIKIDSFTTDREGMYYFKGLKKGNYTLQVNGKTNYPIAVFDTPQQELPPILIKYK